MLSRRTVIYASLRRVSHVIDIRNEEFLSIMDYYCDPELPILQPQNAQLPVSLEMPDAVLANGVDLNHAICRPMFRQLLQNTPRLNDSNGVEVNASATMSRTPRLAPVATFDDAKALRTGWLRDKTKSYCGTGRQGLRYGQSNSHICH